MDDEARIKRGATAAAAGVALPPLQPLQLQPLHSLPLLLPPGTTTRRTRTTYLCVHLRVTSEGAHPGELFVSKALAFFVIFVIFYILLIYYIFHIFLNFSIFSISDICNIFVIFDILHIFDIYITKLKIDIYI
jgi:hypothetical protein